MLNRRVMCACLCLSTLLLCEVRPGWAAEKVAAERLLPPNVVAFVTIPSVPDLKAKWKESLLGQLRNEKALDDFWRDVEAQFETASVEVKKQLGVSLNDLLAIPSGEVALAILQPPGGQLALVGMLDFGENEETVDTLLEKAAAAAADKGTQRQVEEFEDTKIIVYTFGDENAAAAANQPVGNTLAYFKKDSQIVFGSSVAALEAVLTRWSGDHPKTLAESETFRYIAQRSRGDESESSFTWYVDPIGLAKAALAAGGQANFQTNMVMGLLPTLGLNKLKAIGGSVQMVSGDYDTLSRMVVYLDLPATGVLNAFQFPAVEQSPPKWVRSDVTSYIGLNWDVAGAYGAVESLVDSFQGPGTFKVLVDQLAEAPGGPMLHPKRDLIDQLAGRIHFMIDMTDPDNPKSERFLFALAVKDDVKMKGILSTLAKTPGFPGKAEEFNGQTLYKFDIPGAIAGAVGGEATQMGVSVVNGHLMFATNITFLEQVIRADKEQESLAESTAYRKIAEHYPNKVSVLAFQRRNNQVKTLYNLLRSGQANNFDDVRHTGIDFKKLPPFEAIQKYLPITGSYAIPDPKGVLFVSFSLRGRAK